MKTIKVKFMDGFGAGISIDWFVDLLSRHYQVEVSDSPDYIFASGFGSEHLKYNGCVKIFVTGEEVVPDFNLFDYAIGFHKLDFGDRYLRFPLYGLYNRHLPFVEQKHQHTDDYYLAKKKFCNVVVSNDNGDTARVRMWNLLDRYKQVDSGGRFRNNVGGPVKDKLAFERDYKFTLCFENTSMRGYTTEKIFEAFAGETIPIYWGDPDIASEFNPDAFVNCHNYSSFEDALDDIKCINEDPARFLRMIKAPALTPESAATQFLKADCLEKFLCNIFDQHPVAARRVSHGFANGVYAARLSGAISLYSTVGRWSRPFRKLLASLKRRST